MTEPQKIGPIIHDDEIDLVALAQTIWAGRKTILYSVVGCVCIGLAIAFASPVKYTASATLLPSADQKSGSMGSLGALAGLAGVNLGGMMGNSTGIPAELYPQVVQSVPFVLTLMHEPLAWEEFSRPMSLYDKAMRDTIPTVGSVVMKYTLRLPWTMKDAILGKKSASAGTAGAPGELGYYNLTEEEIAVAKAIRELVAVETDKKNGLVMVTATLGEPLQTAQLTSKAIALLQKSVIDYKTQKSADNLKFLEERFAEGKLAYESTQKELFHYRDANRNMVSERMDTEYQRLSDAYDMAATVYKGLAQQVEQARIAVKEDTPVFSILEPVVVPTEKSAPKKGLILAVSIFLGGFLGIGWIFWKMVWANFTRKI